MASEPFDVHPDYGPEVDFENEPLPPARELKRIGPVTDRLIASRAFILGAMGPVGCGKTIAFSTKIQHHAAKQKGLVNSAGQLIRKSRYLWVRDTYPNVDRNTIPSWNKVVPKARGRFVMSTPRVHEFAMVLRRDGHILDTTAKPIDIAVVGVEFRAIGEQSVEDALRGAEFTAGILNEADRMHPDILMYMAGRVGRFSDDFDPDLVVDPFIGLDLNGCDDENWTNKVLVEGVVEPDMERAIRAVSGDRELVDYIEYPPAIIEGEDIPGGWQVNPEAENQGNLPEGYYERQYAFAKVRGNQTYIDRMLRSMFTPPRAGRSVFPEYKHDLHSGEFEAIPGLPLLVMADQGLLGAVLICQMVKGQLRVLEEIACVFETEDDEIEVVQMGGEALGKQAADLLSTKYGGFTIGDAVCDPAGAAGEGAINFKSWRQDFQKGIGFRVRKSRVPKNAIAPRLKAVRERFKPVYGDVRGIFVHRRCKMTIRAFRTKYYYQRIGTRAGEGVYSDIPKKVQGYGDLMDALQYGCFELAKGLSLSEGGLGRIGGNKKPVTNDSGFDVLRERV